jgi:hypothetical protein
MRATTYLRIGVLLVLGLAFLVTSEVYPQRGREKGGKTAGHKAATAPKQAGAGPAMTRPAAQSKAGPHTGARTDGPKETARHPGDGPKGNGPKTAAGPGSGNKTAANFQRPSANKPGDTRPGAAKTGGDAKRSDQVAGGSGRTARPGGNASSAQLNDFLGNGAGRPGSAGLDRPGPGKGDRSEIGRKDDRTGIAGKDNRPITGKKDDRPAVGGKDSRPAVNVAGDVNIGGRTNVNYADNRKAWVDNQHATGNQVRTNAGNRYANAYTSGAYRRGVTGGYGYNRGWAGRGAYYGWSPTSYAGLGTFLGASAVAAQPNYLAYGNGGNVYYDGDNVVVDGTPAGTAEQYAQQAMGFVAAAPAPEKTADVEWLPLGTFAVTREDVEDSQGMVELAIDKQGVIAGTYYNEGSGASRPLKGTFDQKSQRVGIGFADGEKEDAALETGIYNLTQDEAPALLHFGTTQTTPILLVRLKAPE